MVTFPESQYEKVIMLSRPPFMHWNIIINSPQSSGVLWVFCEYLVKRKHNLKCSPILAKETHFHRLRYSTQSPTEYDLWKRSKLLLHQTSQVLLYNKPSVVLSYWVIPELPMGCQRVNLTWSPWGSRDCKLSLTGKYKKWINKNSFPFF